jgi:cell division protein FtsI (penicillin-binding protein 3)
MMQKHHQPSFILWRFYLILGFILLLVLGLIWRVFDLAVLDRHFLMRQGDERVLRKISTPAFRGMIVDRNGYPLAVSTRVYSIWINAKEFTATKAQIKTLSQLVEMQPKAISKLVAQEKKRRREFAYLKRGVSPELERKIKNLNLEGVHSHEEYKRFYPEGEVTAHVVGFTNVDDVGQEGLELAYNQWLEGEHGKKWVIKDRLGRIISEVRNEQNQKPGSDLVLSLDKRIQYLAYRELMKGVIENKANSGTAIVLDVKTGEVLAMANYPSFNPNKRPGKSGTYRNRAVTDLFEPGSTMKAFSISSALDSGLFKPDTIIDTNPGWIRIGKNIVRDEHFKGAITVTNVLQISSNVGVTKMVLTLPPDQLWSMLHKVGFGESTGIGFPGEQAGVLVQRPKWGAFTIATLAFGYGLSVTPIQVARAYGVIANQGEIMPISLLKLDKKPEGKQVMRPLIAKQMVAMLEDVLGTGGTGVKARVPGYRVAGKTGTSVIAGHNGYQKHRYVSSFVGLAPASNPQYVVAVIIHDPQGKAYYGADVCAPAFSHIMEGTLRTMDVAPDEVPPELIAPTVKS